MRYQIVRGIHFEEDNSCSIQPSDVRFVDGETLHEAIVELFSKLRTLGRSVVPMPLFLFGHIPGVECRFDEIGSEQSAVWLLRRLDINNAKNVG